MMESLETHTDPTFNNSSPLEPQSPQLFLEGQTTPSALQGSTPQLELQRFEATPMPLQATQSDLLQLNTEPVDSLTGTSDTSSLTAALTPGDRLIGETGTVTNFDEKSQTITFDHSYTEPVVFANPLTYNGRDPAVVRITEINSNGFTTFLGEPNYLDGRHTLESFSYMVLEAGTWQLADGTVVEVGTINTDAVVKQRWETIDLATSFESAPVILSQVQTHNDSDFVRTRIKDRSGDGFSISLEEEEANLSTGHQAETIGYLAMSIGAGTWSGLKYQAGKTGERMTDDWSKIDFSDDLSQAPNFLASLATYEESDPAGLRYRALSEDGVEVKLEEDRSADRETAHTIEEVTFLLLEGSGLLTGRQYTDEAGNDFAKARQLGTLEDNSTYLYSDWVGAIDPFDYYQFSLSEKTAVTLRLENQAIDAADLELFDRNYQPLNSFVNYSALEDAADGYLDPGTYFARVFTPVNNVSTDYHLSLSAKHNWATITQDGTSHRMGLERIDGSAWIKNTTTWIVSHGNNDSPEGMRELAEAIDGYEAGDQVFTLDWSSAAEGILNLSTSAAWINDAASFAVDKLEAWGISDHHISVAGHSLGAYLSYEIAKGLGSIKNLIALDPATQLPGGYKTDSINFKDYTEWSWGFYSSSFGSDRKAKTADEAFKFDFGSFNPFKHHGSVVNAFSNMLEKNNAGTAGKISKLFALKRMDSSGKPWKRHDGFEAVLKPDELSNGEWMPDFMEYYNGLWFNWPDVYES
jgi:pimeloyl-ACP methyl ester carboxylesterase